jgi:hypothetical protein
MNNSPGVPRPRLSAGGIRFCTACEKWLSLGEFYAYNTNEGAHTKGGGYFRTCKRCWIERMRAYQQKRKLSKVADAPVMSNVSDTEREPNAGAPAPQADGKSTGSLERGLDDREHAEQSSDTPVTNVPERGLSDPERPARQRLYGVANRPRLYGEQHWRKDR